MEMLKKSYIHQDAGIALAFFVVVFIGIIGVFGLAIDSYLATTSKSQYQTAADAAALAAIEQFTQSFSSTPNAITASAAATNKAKLVLQKNVDVLVSGQFLQDSQQDAVGSGKDNSQANGYLEPGFWVTIEEGVDATDGRGCGVGKAPCFQVYNSGLDDDVPDAFRVRININQASPIRTTFMSLFGVDSYGLTAEAIGTITRRQGIFLIDMSPSIHETSHNLIPVGGTVSDAEVDGSGVGDYYDGEFDCKHYNEEVDPQVATSRQQTLFAYPLGKGITCSQGQTITQDMILNRGENVAPEANPYCIYKHLPTSAAAYGGTRIDNWSYKSDFECYQVPIAGDTLSPADVDYDGALIRKFFAIDVNRTPEPLTSVIRGVNNALKIFEERAVHGDKVGVFGFDDRIYDAEEQEGGFLHIRSTVIDSIDASTGVEPAVVGSQATAFSELIADTDVDVSPTRYWSRFLFPQFFSNNSAGTFETRQPVNTDIFAALQQSVQVLENQPNSGASEKFVVLFSDGKSNCMPNGADINCHGQDGLMHKQAIYRAANYVLNGDFASSNISFHVVLVGDSVKPHNLLKTNPDSTGCLSDRVARQMARSSALNRSNFNFTDPGNGIGNEYGLIDGDYPFSNHFYKSVADSSGLWLPLRDPCVQGVDLLSGANGNGLEGALERSCASKSGRGATLNMGDIDSSSGLRDILDNGTPGDTSDDLLDSKGRLLCDPTGKTKTEQIEEFIRLLMEQNPIRLVGRKDIGL